MNPTRDDLRIMVMGPNGDEPTKVSDEELAAMGLVQAPECGECGGSGRLPHEVVQLIGGEREIIPERPCTVCGGSGYGRLASLDVDVELVKMALNPVVANRKYQDKANEARRLVCKAVLAALDGEGEA